MFLLLIPGLTSADPAKAVDRHSSGLEVVAAIDKGPGNITVTPMGDVIVSLHQFFNHDMRVVRVDREAGLVAFAEQAKLDSVLGLQADTNNVVWLLDNAMREGGRPRLVGWHAKDDRQVADIDLTAVSIKGSFLNDLAVDAGRNTVYIADPANGADAAIIVVDLVSGESRRVLQGHASVIPEDIDLIIDGTPVRIRGDDGVEFRPRVGINPIALDRSGEWLYFGPMHGMSMYRIRAADLRDVRLTEQDLAARVERWADKPICDGIVIDDLGNLYLGDLANNAIGVISADRQYRSLFVEPRLSWIDAFSLGPDGYLYTVANQLHRTAVLNAGQDKTNAPFLILRFRPLAQ
jgi:sugar lactone lactonase YvrE